MKIFDFIKENTRNYKPTEIYCYGPSTTSFEYVFPNWCEVLRYGLKTALEEYFDDYNQINWNLFVHNMGLDGAVSSELLERLNSLVLSKNPNVVFISATTNDFCHNLPIKDMRENMFKIISDSLEAGAYTIFFTMVPSINEKHNNEYAKYLKEEIAISEEFSHNERFIFVNMFDIFPKELLEKSYTYIEENENHVVGVESGTIDYIHYNRYGNVVVAKIFLKEIFGVEFDHDQFLKDINDETIKYPRF